MSLFHLCPLFTWAAINHGQCAVDLFEEGLESQTFGEGTQTLQGDYDYADVIAGTNDPPNLVNRLSAGRQQWRGSEGSQTDLASSDATDGQSPATYLYAADTQPSTGLIYMQARYYDPQVGRFTQTDPLPYGPEAMWWQNNRWTYCANDPVNCSDPSGESLKGLFGFGLMLFGLIGMGVVGFAVWGMFTNPGALAAMAANPLGFLNTLAVATADFLWALGMFLLGLSWLLADLGKACWARQAARYSGMALMAAAMLNVANPYNIKSGTAFIKQAASFMLGYNNTFG